MDELRAALRRVQALYIDGKCYNVYLFPSRIVLTFAGAERRDERIYKGDEALEVFTTRDGHIYDKVTDEKLDVIRLW